MPFFLAISDLLWHNFHIELGWALALFTPSLYFVYFSWGVEIFA